MKTYSVAIKSKKGYWLTNWNQYFSLEDINWEEVKRFASEGYGYYFGHNSRNLCSDRTRTVLFERENYPGVQK
jgi:hypothetical protein